MRLGWVFGSAAAAIAIVSATPAFAQQQPGEAEIDALLDASTTPEGAIALARQQAAEGDLTGAAATLERALLTNRGATEVRLAYVALLCRLDDRQRARVELAAAGGTPSSEVQAACGEIAPAEGQKRSSNWHGQIAAGLAYDRDVSGALALELDIPGLIYARKDGVAFTASASVSGRSAIGGNAFFYGDLSVQTRNDISGPSYDYQVGSGSAGLGIDAGGVELSAGGTLRHALVGGDRFLTEAGGEARIAVPLGSNVRIALRGEAVHQNYLNVPLISRDGSRYDLALSLSSGTARTFSYGLGGGWERKTADTNYLAYRGWRLFGAVRAPLGGGGAYGSLGGTYRRIDYYNDPLTRDYVEDRWFGRAALGVPLTGNLLVEGAANYTRRDYNAASFLRDYHSVGGELRLIFKFGE